MLIIGHRGAAGLAPENTLKALEAGVNAGADILEFDVRLTRDDIPVLVHDAFFHGMRVSSHTYKSLSSRGRLTTLKQVLDGYFSKILLNIELKRARDTDAVFDLVASYIKREDDWDNVIFSSFSPRALSKLRARSKNVNLALLHRINPFAYMRVHKKVNLSAIGFHRLHINPFSLAIAKELDIFTYVYTVDNPAVAKRLQQKGVNGIVTNYPDRIVSGFQADA